MLLLQVELCHSHENREVRDWGHLHTLVSERAVSWHLPNGQSRTRYLWGWQQCLGSSKGGVRLLQGSGVRPVAEIRTPRMWWVNMRDDQRVTHTPTFRSNML